MRALIPALAAAVLCLAAARAETAESRAPTRIEWAHDLRAVLSAAASDGKEIVLVTDGDNGRFFEDVLRCPTFNTLAGQAHFALIKLPLADDNGDARRLLAALDIDPAFASTVAVLRPGAFPITGVLRVRGYRDEASLLSTLAEAGFAASAPSASIEQIAVGDDAPRDCLK